MRRAAGKQITKHAAHFRRQFRQLGDGHPLQCVGGFEICEVFMHEGKFLAAV
jgi:hypothetical protein